MRAEKFNSDFIEARLHICVAEQRTWHVAVKQMSNERVEDYVVGYRAGWQKAIAELRAAGMLRESAR